MFTEDYVNSYSLHRTSTGPGINSYVPTADLNLKAGVQKKVIKRGKVKMGGKYDTKEGTFKGSMTDVIDVVLQDISQLLYKELNSGKLTTFNKIAGLVKQKASLEKSPSGTSKVILKR
jgi:hypothetical protein